MRRNYFVMPALALGALSAVLVGPAGADPKKGEVVPLECDNGQSYEAVVSPGNGNFTPAHDMAGTGTFVPVGFGEFTGTITGPDGAPIGSFTDPPVAKGQSAKNRSVLTCTFSFIFVNDGSDPTSPIGTTFEGSGSVTGFLTPANKK